MPLGRDLTRIGAAIGCAAAVLFHIAPARAQSGSVPPLDKRITYILPQWLDFLSATPATVTAQLADLRMRIGGGPDSPRVRTGFTTYIDITMDPVDPSDIAGIDAALAPTFTQIDTAIANAVVNDMPICLSFVTAVRGGVDPLQIQAQDEDRRNMQWRADNSMAPGWTTFSRYARKQELIQEAYIREVGRHLAHQMWLHPDVLVAASGDGEIELAAFDPFTDAQGNLIVADYSPFAVAEFRDWLRSSGLYAPGQPFAGEAYANASRYASDTAYLTLNSDFGSSFDTWNLKYFDWSLADSTSSDPHAIPATQYNDSSFDKFALSNPDGFDPPREHVRGNPWSDLWDTFRESLVYRHNLEFAKWITTSPDPQSGATVPAERWFTDQIPGDYLFGGTPSNPNGRFDTSASSIATADVRPYGSLGITSFNANLLASPTGADPEGVYARTLVGAAPAIAARKVRWGVFEWNPAVGPTSDPTIYTDEMSLVKQHHPSLLAPFLWDPASIYSIYSVEGTPFETALKQLVTDLNNVPLTLSRSSIDIGAVSNGAAISPPQTIRVSGVPGETPAWSITSASPELTATQSADGRSFTVALNPGTYPPGTATDTVRITPSTPGYTASTLTVTVRVSLPGTTHPPQGSVDTPVESASIAGEVAFTGWAVDDVGLAGVSICRGAVTGEATSPNPGACGGLNNVFVGTATFVPNARPDVLAAFPGMPLNDQAGWGYMLLSNMLPNGGNGPFTISVVATDVDGHSVQIAQRHVNGQNSGSLLPFGTIDTPKQGETIGGSAFVNFGWALSANPIATDGSTMSVLVDGVVVGHPVYNNFRSDIASLFPGLPNSNGAIGYFVLDTTPLSNGLHSIAWIVTDSSGATQGVGSRFFTVANP